MNLKSADDTVMTEQTEAVKAAAEDILKFADLDSDDYDFLVGEASEIIQRLLDERDAKIIRLKKQLTEITDSLNKPFEGGRLT